MDEATLKINLNTLKEMILDERKLVTYVSLSKELCVHVNDSKSLLSTIVQDIKIKQPDLDLNVCYIVSGLTDGNNARTTVASENELDSLKKSLKMVLFEHIYSVNVGLPSVDNVAFLAINKFEDFPLCTGLIKSTSCIKRTPDEIGNLKSSSQEVVVEKKAVNPLIKKIKVEVKPAIQNGHDNTKTVTKIHESKSEPIIKNEIPSPKKDVAGNNSKQKVDNRKNGNKSQKGIAGFFTKSNSVPSNEVRKIDIKPDIIDKQKEIKKTSPEVKHEEMDVEEEVEIKKEVVKTEHKKENVSNNKHKNNKSLKQIKKNAKVDNKRKRVLHVSDSESEDEKNDPFIDETDLNHESEDEIPPTPTVNTVKITSGITNPKKKRKVVDKTYTDEDGYILTKKVEIYESCSENEDEVHVKENLVHVKENVEVQKVIQIKPEVSPRKKNATKNSKKKISPPQKGKQAMLTSFFKKV